MYKKVLLFSKKYNLKTYNCKNKWVFRTEVLLVKEATCTDVEQYWSKGRLKLLSKEMYKVQPVKKLCHGNKKSKFTSLEHLSEEKIKSASDTLLNSEFKKE